MRAALRLIIPHRPDRDKVAYGSFPLECWYCLPIPPSVRAWGFAPPPVRFGRQGSFRGRLPACRARFVSQTFAFGRACAQQHFAEGQILAFIAEGVRTSNLARVKEHKEDAIWDRLRAAAHHAEEITGSAACTRAVSQGKAWRLSDSASFLTPLPVSSS